MLSFDDGPSKVLPQILDILEEEKVPAYFFWQSRLLHKGRPWQRLLEQGHKIGTHTMKHKNLVKLSYVSQYKDIARSVKEMEEITGTKITHLRPPFGQYNSDTIKAANQLGLEVILWKVAAIDWELASDPEQIVSNIVDNLQDGAIILLHELKQTVDVLPSLIQKIKSKGYTFEVL